MICFDRFVRHGRFQTMRMRKNTVNLDLATKEVLYHTIPGNSPIVQSTQVIFRGTSKLE